MAKGMVAVALLVCLLALSTAPVKAQAESVLHVIVLYDGDYDGTEEGVGIGVPVLVRESGSAEETLNFTDNRSTADFLVEKGTYIANAYPRQTRFFFTWVCSGSKFVDGPNEYLFLYCVERFFIRLPWANE